MPPTSEHRYFTSTAVLLNEVIKLALATTFAIYEVSRNLAPQTPATVLFEQIYRSVFSGDGWKLAIPATLYTFENTLQYVALGNLDPVHFQVLYQLKVGQRIYNLQHASERIAIPFRISLLTVIFSFADSHNGHFQRLPPRPKPECQALGFCRPPNPWGGHCMLAFWL